MFVNKLEAEVGKNLRSVNSSMLSSQHSFHRVLKYLFLPKHRIEDVSLEATDNLDQAIYGAVCERVSAGFSRFISAH